MSRHDGPLVKRLLDAQRKITGVCHVEFCIIDKDSEEVLKKIKPEKKAKYRILFRV
jgi:hypothetical protein